VVIGVGRTPEDIGVVLDRVSVSQEDVVVPGMEVKESVDKVLEDVYELLGLVKRLVVVVVHSMVVVDSEVSVKMEVVLEVDTNDVSVGVFELLATELLIELEALLELKVELNEVEIVVVVGSGE
jgi:hypothetical protein